MSLAYDEYLAEHIGNVNKGLHWMLDNLGLSQEEKSAIETAMVSFNHDESKYSTEEYDAYDKYFYGGNRSYKVVQDFNYAWLHHIHQNPHHWQYWVLLEDDPEAGLPYKTLPIPLPYIFEMIADWWSFSWKSGNLFEIFNWYAEHREKQYINLNSRMILERILEKIWDVLLMQEAVAGRDISEIEGQYRRFWIEQKNTIDVINKMVELGHPNVLTAQEMEFLVKHSDSEPIGKVISTHETENGLEVTIEHSGIKGQKWGIRNGPPYPLGDKEKLDSVKKLNDLMNNGWDYGVLDHGKHLLDTDDYDWDKNYRTTPVDILEKEKIGTCWDFVNYQHDKLKHMGIKDNSYLITIQKSEKPDDIVTHTFTTFELGDKQYWLESAAWPKRGVHEINGIEDVAKELNEMYHNPGLGLSIFKYNPEGMDKGLTSNEFFDKASQNLVYDEEPIKHSDTDYTDEDLYGVPELKKFPMPDKKHVKSAIRFFNYVDPKYEKELAEAILEKAKEFGVVFDADITVGDENRLKKYLPKKKEES